jgi:hypothetical protein
LKGCFEKKSVALCKNTMVLSNSAAETSNTAEGQESKASKKLKNNACKDAWQCGILKKSPLEEENDEETK